MKCQGNFVFKGIEEREGGEFVNSNGQKIVYDSKYVLKVDERGEDGKIYDRKFAIDKKETNLIKTLQACEPYSDIVIDFDIKIYNSQVKLVPIGIIED